MKPGRRGYLMAMVASMTIIAASTGGIALARDHQQSAEAAAQVQSAALAESESPSASPAGSSPDEPSTVAGASTPQASVGTPQGSTVPVSPTGVAAGTAKRASSTAAPPIPTTTSKASPTTPKALPTTAAAAPATYKDGKYSATGSYDSPGGTEKLGVTLTLKADKITAVELDLLGGAGLSHGFQSAFASGFLPQVSGKDIDSVHLGAVAGSSLTGLGFNDALKQIEGQAHA